MGKKKKAAAAAMAVVHPEAEGFREKVTAKPISNELFLFKCAKCGGVHFRHAGYLWTMIPFLKTDNRKEVAMDEPRVMICVKCKSAFTRIEQQMYDISEHIDLSAWEKSEKDLQKATGPGGQC